MIAATLASAQSLHDFTTPTPVPEGSTLVIGFLGGWEPWDSPERSVRRLALKLREQPGFYAESCGNHNRDTAMEFLHRALDADANGEIDAVEAKRVRIILYGQSLGGWAVLRTARDLEKWGVPVALTVQIDSVGVGDNVVPANVRSAVNLYQHEPLTIQGETEIRAADPTRTQILANRRFNYGLLGGPKPTGFWRKKFGGAHAKMESDPKVWNMVESFIFEAAPVAPINTTEARSR
jgi:hypothetical protein